MTRQSDLQGSYDHIADEYARRLFDELDHKPLDREILDRFAERARGRGPVYDIGCGPGIVARYLHQREIQVTGVDLSLGMVERARQLNPGITFLQGDMRSLDVPDASLGGIVAFYSILHVPPDEVVAVLGELRRALRPACPLLLSFHIGKEPLHVDELWGHRVTLDFFFFESAAMKAYLEEAGFEGVEVIERDPYPDVEVQTRRAYLSARAPGPPA
jgi:SAM-dependent methyltransferase